MSRLTFSAILFLGLCCISNNVLAQEARATHDQQKQLKDDPILYITAGYSSDEQMATGMRCVIQDPSLFSYQGGSKSVLSLGDERDFNQFQEDLNVNISASGSYGMFSGSADANYARQVEDDNYSENFYYDEIIQLPTEIYTPQSLGNQMLNSFGQQAEQLDSTGQAFRSYCGDQYVMQTPLGARLAVTFKLNFASQKDHETFDANISGGMGSIFSASAAVSSVVSRYNLQGSLSVYALQDGGDATQLAKIFGSPTCGGHYCVSTCDLNNLSYCQGIIDGIISYAANDFPAQIDFKDGQPSTLAIPLSYTMGIYPGVKVGTTLVTPAVVKARVALGDLYTQQLQQFTFANHILTSAQIVPYMSYDSMQQLQKLVATLSNNISILTNPATGAAACYQTPDQCVNIYNNIMNQIQPIDQQFLDQFTTAYSVVDTTGDYFNLPLGENQYLQINRNNQSVTSQNLSLTPITSPSGDPIGLHLDEIDIEGHHIAGDLYKQPNGTYQGTVPSGAVTFTVIQNPI